jgi:hypothetical protein
VPRLTSARLLEYALAEPSRGGLRSVRHDHRVPATTIDAVMQPPYERRLRVRRWNRDWGHGGEGATAVPP